MTYAAYRQAGPAATFQPIASGLRVAFLVAMIVELASFVAAVTSWIALFASIDHQQPNAEPPTALFIAIGSSYGGLVLSMMITVGLGVAWMHRAWSWLPIDQRYAKNWRSWVTPGQAAGFLLIPYFHYYWMFVVNLGLCDALDRLRVLYPTKEAAPKQLVLVACILQILFWPAAIVLFYIYMLRVERMTVEMSEAHNARQRYAF
jgi:hypothetical protein